MDNKLLENIIKALEYEEMIFDKILNIGKEKTDVLVKNQPEKLIELTQREQAMIDQLVQLEKVREQLSGKLAASLNLKKDENIISRICSMLPKDQADLLGSSQKRLRKVVSEVSLRNQINQKLIENALNYVSFSIQMLTQPQASVPRYGRMGDDVSSKMPARSMMDLRS